MKGSCLCGDVTYTVEGEISGLSVCHCGQCRKQSGHLWASGYVLDEQIQIEGPVQWFASSETAERGFCPRCGAFLFWRKQGEGTTSFSLGSLDGETGLKLEKHIFAGEKGDYYEILDGLPLYS
ncbi:MAG: GFA family protein [Pseudomonadota bacterium]